MKDENEEITRLKPASLEVLAASRAAAERVRDEWRERKNAAMKEGLYVAAEVASDWEIRAEVELIEIKRRIQKLTKGA